MKVDKFQSLMKERRQPRHIKHPEHDLQVQCVKWFRLQFPTYSWALFAVPNGAKLEGNEAQRMFRGKMLKDEGLLKGVADLLLLIPSGGKHGLAIEMKWHDNYPSKEQKEWGAHIEAVGYEYAVCKPREGATDALTIRYGVDRFISIITNYLKERI